MNISIFASIGAQNLGDELILKNEIQLLKKEFVENTRFRVFTYDIRNPFFLDRQVDYLEYFPIASRNPKNIFRNTKNFGSFLSTLLWSDIVVIGWWWIIYDSELQSNKNPLDQWVFRSKIAKKLKKKIYFYALGIDIKHPENKDKLKTIFQWAWKITVRDKKSFLALKDIWIESHIVLDPVYSERGDFKAAKRSLLCSYSSRGFALKDLEKYNFSGKRVGLALRQGYIGKSQNEKIEKLMLEEVFQYIEKQWATLVFLPHSFHEQDQVANDFVFLSSFVKGSRSIKNSLQEVYKVYTHREIDINIAMRLHSIILSEVYEIPYIALSYSQKTDETLKNLSF